MKLVFAAKLFSVFDVEGIVVENIMTLSKLSVSYAWILTFTSFGSFSKLIISQSKRVNPFEK